MSYFIHIKVLDTRHNYIMRNVKEKESALFKQILPEENYLYCIRKIPVPDQ